MTDTSQDDVMIDSAQSSLQGPSFVFGTFSDGTVTAETTSYSSSRGTPIAVQVSSYETALVHSPNHAPNHAPAGVSELKFASIPTICDSGVELHAEWEKEQRRMNQSTPKAKTRPPPTPKSVSAKKHRKRRKTKKRRSSTPESPESLADINVHAVSDHLCQAFKVSAFSKDNYLPLDALNRILTPAVVRVLLEQHVKGGSNRISELETQVLGCPIQQTPGRRRIFAILVLIGQVVKLTDFVDNNVDDTALPFTFTFTPASGTMKQLASARVGSLAIPSLWGPKSTQDFLIYQKVVHVPFFRFPGPELYFYDLEPGSILPFHSDKAVVSGGYGSVRKVAIHDAHHDHGDYGEKSPSFAVKRLHAANPQEFVDEVQVFERLRSANHKDRKPSHLIPLQLTYKRGIDFYLVFPWADGNLKEYWQTDRRDPRAHADVCWFMTQCLGIARGLSRIHHLSTLSIENAKAKVQDVQAKVQAVAAAASSNSTTKMPTLHPSSDDVEQLKQLLLSPTVDRQEWGRHGDIKPENILWFREYKQQDDGGDGDGSPDPLKDHMVISDFGLTCFNTAHSRSRVLQDQIRGFSGTYRPPDLHLEQPITQRYDVWSLGCVLLEFTSWFLRGYDDGVNDFVAARVQDALEIAQQREDKFFGMPNRTRRTKKMEAVLKDSVIEWIARLHDECSEPIHALLDLIQFEMLVPNAKNRMDCNRIREELRTLHEKCNQTPDYATDATPKKPQRLRFAGHARKS